MIARINLSQLIVLSWFFYDSANPNEKIMANKEQIQKHLSLSSSLRLSPSTPDIRAEQVRKARIMEHLKLSKGQR